MLWPFATKCAQYRMNNLHVDLNLETPDMRFSNTNAVNVQLKHYHTFGCPVYILYSRLQTNPKGVPKWEPRSRLGIYVFHSPEHAGSVALVLKHKTGLLSPKYHVVYEYQFSTVNLVRDLTVPPNWSQLVSYIKAVNVQLKHYHTFGCPVYILDSILQTNPKGVPKLEP